MRRQITSSLMATVIAVTFAAAPVSAQLAGMTMFEPEVIDNGAEPWQELRYRFAEGQIETAGMDMTMDMTNTMDGTALVDMEMLISARIETEVTDVYDDGSARAEMVFVRYDVADTGDALVDAELDALSAGMVGAMMWQVIDDRGNVLEFGVDATAPEVEAQLLDATAVVQSLPEEPVGIGARWVAKGSMDAEGVPIQMSIETQLVELDEEGIVLEMTITGDADAPSAFFGEMPPGVDFSIDRFSVGGGGQMTIEFDSLVPNSEAVSEVDLAMSVSATEDGDTVSIEMGFDMSMGMEFYLVE